MLVDLSQLAFKILRSSDSLAKLFSMLSLK